MNFPVGFLLLVSGGCEIDVFWTFVNLFKEPKYMLIGLYESQMPLL